MQTMKEEGNRKLGKRIKQARQEAGMSQKELARRVDRTQGVVSTVENGLSTIDAPDLPRWAAALGKPVMYFYLGEGLEDAQQRAAAALSLLSPDKLEVVLQMLEGMALTTQQEGNPPG